jgi:choline dehydrogenase-like flavoprotein
MKAFAANSVAVAGTGPSGLMAAQELAAAGIDVTLFEAGGMLAGRAAPWRNDAEIADPQRHAPMALSARRGFGGTSALWGGRCVPLDPIDLARRDWVPHSGWPIAWATLAEWYPKACAFLGCGPSAFEEARGDIDLMLERWCAQPNIGAEKIKAITAHPRIRIAADTVVTRIVLDDAGRAAIALECRRNGTTERIPVRAAIVAAGGVETARLLLNSRVDRPALFGGESGALGRYYMGHIYGSIADIVFDKPGDDARFDYQRAPGQPYFRRRFSLPGETQTQHRLLNMSAWPEVPVIADARHSSAILSMGYLALAAPFVGPRLTAPAIRARKLAGGDGRVLPHIANVLRNPFGAAAFAASFGWARYASRIRKPGFFPLNPARRYSLFHHGEHAPNPDSRITLTQARDEDGMFRARIDLRFSEQDAASIAGSVSTMGGRLAGNAGARLEHLFPEAERSAAALAQASDGFHQIGTARMADDPRYGVVDADSRVHGVGNLFIAGSAVFPTSGQANPTLTAVALAARLAAYITQEFRSLPPASGV